MTFTLDAAGALADAEVVFICVGTPARADGEANLVAMEQTASQIARHAHDESSWWRSRRFPPGPQIGSGPPSNERARASGSTWHPTRSSFERGWRIHDALEPDRIVVGVESARGLEVLRRLYASLLETALH